MGVNYAAVLWNRQKKIYDLVMIGLILLYLLAFIFITLTFHPDITQETLLIRAFGTLALVMLQIILLIGPLSRLNKKFLPLLYNRRHLGVTMFLMASVHGIFSILQFHSGGDVNPLVSVFTANTDYGSLANFPFQTLGFVALVILFLMASTSHDFWLKNLSPLVWKTLHMFVYLAYFLVVLHVALGVIQDDINPVLLGVVAVGASLLIVLHLTAGFQAIRSDNQTNSADEAQYLLVGAVNQIPNNRAKIIHHQGESIAVFKYDGKLSAISNVCKHQHGPLGEGRVIDGCITCPWHGYQYLPENGCSPPPFKEKVSTYDLKVVAGKVWVNPRPHPEGTRIEPMTL